MCALAAMAPDVPGRNERTTFNPALLLVEDDESLRVRLAANLALAGYDVHQASTLADARERLAAASFSLALVDLHLPDGTGFDMLRHIQTASPQTGVVMITGHGTIREAIQAIREGAHDFLGKPCHQEELEAALARAAEKRSLERSNDALRREVERLRAESGFVGNSPHVHELLGMVERVASTDFTVLLRGESGVGKELVAHAVHRASARSRQPFVVVDCASLHENLLQSELFGHERGAYTGAVSLKHGLFEVADHGTLFLDEIGELTPALQVKLLRVLETGTFRRLGGTADLRVDVRVIAATNRDLEAMMHAGQFREDLYYRLSGFTLSIPSLRERREDIPLLVQHFVARFPMAARRGTVVTPGAMEALRRHAWPGNVRELKNVVERGLILCGERLELEHLPMNVRADTEPRPEAGSDSMVTLADCERHHILRVLTLCNGHRSRAAAILGMSERTLYRRLHEFERETA